MKAISLWQPWATLMVHGWKRVETRSWDANHSGLIAIHATKTLPREGRELLNTDPFAQALCSAGYGCDGVEADRLPHSAILGVGDLTHCLQMTEESCEYMREAEGLEVAFGLYEPGRWEWRFRKITRFAEPIPCDGHQKLWEVRGAAAEELEDRLRKAGVSAPEAAQLALAATQPKSGEGADRG